MMRRSAAVRSCQWRCLSCTLVTRVQVIRYCTRYSSVLMTKADGKQFHSEVFDRTPEPTRRHLWRASPGPHTFLERQAPAQ